MGCSIQSLIIHINSLKQNLPDSQLHNLIELLIDTKKTQAISIISNKLNPARWNAYVSDITKRVDAENEINAALRKVRRAINNRLGRLANGAKYE